MTEHNPYASPRRTLEGDEPLETICGRPTCECPPEAQDLDAADAALQVISAIADDLEDWAGAKYGRGFVMRQANRLREHVRKVDKALFGGEE